MISVHTAAPFLNQNRMRCNAPVPRFILLSLPLIRRSMTIEKQYCQKCDHSWYPNSERKPKVVHDANRIIGIKWRVERNDIQRSKQLDDYCHSSCAFDNGMGNSGYCSTDVRQYSTNFRSDSRWNSSNHHRNGICCWCIR